MDAVKCLEETQRMCKGRGCMNCPLENADCENFMSIKPVEFVAIVEKWSAEHPVKSYLDVFKKAMASVGVTYPDDEWIIDNFCVVKIFTGKSPLTNCPYLNKKSGCPDCWRSECKLPIKGE